MLICLVCPFVNLWTKLGLYPKNMGVYHSQKKIRKSRLGKFPIGRSAFHLETSPVRCRLLSVLCLLLTKCPAKDVDVT